MATIDISSDNLLFLFTPLSTVLQLSQILDDRSYKLPTLIYLPFCHCENPELSLRGRGTRDRDRRAVAISLLS